MVAIRVLISFCLACLVSACATTNFLPYEGQSEPLQGRGGTKQIIEGMEVWSNGEPPRKFKVIGVIEDTRPSGPLPMSSLATDVVAKARESGGDAVIKQSSQSQVTGYVTNGSASVYGSSNHARAYGTATTIPVGKNHAKFLVIKYAD